MMSYKKQYVFPTNEQKEQWNAATRAVFEFLDNSDENKDARTCGKSHTVPEIQESTGCTRSQVYAALRTLRDQWLVSRGEKWGAPSSRCPTCGETPRRRPQIVYFRNSLEEQRYHGELAAAKWAHGMSQSS